MQNANHRPRAKSKCSSIAWKLAILVTTFVAGAFFERTMTAFSNELENETKLERQIDQAINDPPRATPPRALASAETSTQVSVEASHSHGAEADGHRALRVGLDKKLHANSPPIFEHETILGSFMGGLLRESKYGLVHLIPEGSFLDAGMQVS